MFGAQFKARASPASGIAFFVGISGFNRLENLLVLWLPYRKNCGDPALNNLLPQIPFCHRVSIIRAIVDDALHKISEIGRIESSLWCYCAKWLNGFSEIAGRGFPETTIGNLRREELLWGTRWVARREDPW